MLLGLGGQLVARRCCFLAGSRTLSPRRLSYSSSNSTAAMAMLSPPELAAKRAGLTLEQAFSIDEVQPSMFARLGAEPITRLAHEFYDRVYADEEQWFRGVFASSPKQMAIRNQYEFMIQRLGGPTLYSQRKGHPALPRRHAPFDCSEATAERYMRHMDAALKAVPEIDEDSRQRLHSYFKHTCYFLVIAQEMRQAMQTQAAAEAAAAAEERQQPEQAAAAATAQHASPHPPSQ